MNGIGNVQLVAQEDGRTLMKYEGEMQIGGKLASVGQRLLDSASKSIINQGLLAMNQALLARMAAQETGKEVAYTPPSETAFAASVAKDMAGEVLSSRRMWIGLGILILIIIVVVILVTR